MIFDAVKDGQINVNEEDDIYPIIHIRDLADLYQLILNQPDHIIAGKKYNACAQNLTSLEIGKQIQRSMGSSAILNFNQFYRSLPIRICSNLIEKEIGFRPKHTIQHAYKKLFAVFHNKDE